MNSVDIHHHLIAEKDYADSLLRAMDTFGIERTGLIGLGPLFNGLFATGERGAACPDNGAVEIAVRQHPDRFFGLGFVRLGVDGPAQVDELADRGFRGLKFHIPKDRYDADSFSPIYSRAVHHGLPCLFHTGIVRLPTPRPNEGIRSSYMEPIHLEGVAQEFPELCIILAHLGVQSYLTALTLIRIFPNIHADISGSVPGWRANLAPEDWKRLLWFEDAPQKLLFGTDVHCREFAPTLAMYETVFQAAGWAADQRLAVMRGNAMRLFGLDGQS